MTHQNILSDGRYSEKVSKRLSYALRHDPKNFNLTVLEHGFVRVDEVLKALSLSFQDLKFIVNNDTKKRYEFNNNFSLIRAVQGHSFNVDLGLKNVTPPRVLFHGTNMIAWSSIKNEGLIPGVRQSVHLSENLETAFDVASRRKKSKIVLLEVSSGLMNFQGYKFQKAPNGVWLTDSVPSEFLKIVE